MSSTSSASTIVAIAQPSDTPLPCFEKTPPQDLQKWGNIFMFHKQYMKALCCYHLAMKKEGITPLLLNAKYCAKKALGLNFGAIKNLLQAEQLDSRGAQNGEHYLPCPDLFWNLTRYYQAIGDWKKAEFYCKFAKRVYSKMHKSNDAEQCAKKLQEIEAEEKITSTALKVVNNASPYYQALALKLEGESLWTSKDFSHASTFFLEAQKKLSCETDPGKYDACRFLAFDLQRKLEDLESAQKAFAANAKS